MVQVRLYTMFILFCGEPDTFVPFTIGHIVIKLQKVVTIKLYSWEQSKSSPMSFSTFHSIHHLLLLYFIYNTSLWKCWIEPTVCIKYDMHMLYIQCLCDRPCQKENVISLCVRKNCIKRE